MKKHSLFFSVLVLLAVGAALATVLTSCADLADDGDSQATSDVAVTSASAALITTKAATTTTTTAATTTATVTTTAVVPKTLATDSTVSSRLSFTKTGEGVCTLTGLGNCSDACVIIPATDGNGNRVVGIAAGAFQSGKVSAIEIPETVEVIADGAFAGCSKLTYISVSLNNKAYCSKDGILYNADKTALICCPAARPEASLTIAATVKTISPYAFDGCQALKTITYAGSQADWKTVKVGYENAVLAAATWYYEKEDGKS